MLMLLAVPWLHLYTEKLKLCGIPFLVRLTGCRDTCPTLFKKKILFLPFEEFLTEHFALKEQIGTILSLCYQPVGGATFLFFWECSLKWYVCWYGPLEQVRFVWNYRLIICHWCIWPKREFHTVSTFLCTNGARGKLKALTWWNTTWQSCFKVVIRPFLWYINE